MVVLGAAMIVAAPITGGASAVWGADLICSSVTGRSMFDHIGQFFMRSADTVAAGLGINGGEGFWTDDTINNFQFMHFTSDRSMDLLLQEAVAAGMSSVGGKVSGRLKNILGFADDVGEEAAERATRSILSRALSAINSKLGIDFSAIGGKIAGWITKHIPKGAWLAKGLKWMQNKASIGPGWMMKHAQDAIMETISEWSFDCLSKLDSNKRPSFGNTGFFFTIMTASVILGAITRHTTDTYRKLGDVDDIDQYWEAGLRQYQYRTVVELCNRLSIAIYALAIVVMAPAVVSSGIIF